MQTYTRKTQSVGRWETSGALSTKNKTLFSCNNWLYKVFTFYEAVEHRMKELPEQPSEMVFQHWWPECLSFSAGAGNSGKQSLSGTV